MGTCRRHQAPPHIEQHHRAIFGKTRHRDIPRRNLYQHQRRHRFHDHHRSRFSLAPLPRGITREDYIFKENHLIRSIGISIEILDSLFGAGRCRIMLQLGKTFAKDPFRIAKIFMVGNGLFKSLCENIPVETRRIRSRTFLVRIDFQPRIIVETVNRMLR